jgi:O-antigen ligase
VNNLSQASESLRDRRLLAERAWQDMLDHPLCGLGPRGFSESSGKEIMHEPGFHPHNILLTVGNETGFPGLLLFLLFLAGLARISWRRINLMLLLSFIMLAGQQLDCFFFDNLFSIIWAIVTALGLKAADETPA